MTEIHMHFFHELYAQLRASLCSLNDAKVILMTHKMKHWEKSIVQ